MISGFRISFRSSFASIWSCLAALFHSNSGFHGQIYNLCLVVEDRTEYDIVIRFQHYQPGIYEDMRFSGGFEHANQQRCRRFGENGHPFHYCDVDSVHGIWEAPLPNGSLYVKIGLHNEEPGYDPTYPFIESDFDCLVGDYAPGSPLSLITNDCCGAGGIESDSRGESSGTPGSTVWMKDHNGNDCSPGGLGFDAGHGGSRGDDPLLGGGGQDVFVHSPWCIWWSLNLSSYLED